VKFEAFSELYHFESLKGFKTDKIDFSVIEFFGPIFINFKQKQSTLKSQSMNLFLDKKSKEIDRAIFNENIQFHNAKFDIKSDKATYFANKNQLIFEENLVVTSNGKRLNGSLFIYDINKDIGHIEAGKKTNNKVEIFFNDTNNKK